MGYTKHEDIRTAKLEFSFTGAAANGANGSIDIFKDPEIALDINEFVYDVFYRVTTPLTSGDTSGTYLKIGLIVDDDECVLSSTTGIIDTLNANSGGFRPAITYTQSTVLSRDIVAEVGGTDDITGGDIEVIMLIARCDEVYLDAVISTDVE